MANVQYLFDKKFKALIDLWKESVASLPNEVIVELNRLNPETASVFYNRTKIYVSQDTYDKDLIHSVFKLANGDLEVIFKSRWYFFDNIETLGRQLDYTKRSQSLTIKQADSCIINNFRILDPIWERLISIFDLSYFKQRLEECANEDDLTKLIDRLKAFLVQRRSRELTNNKKFYENIISLFLDLPYIRISGKIKSIIRENDEVKIYIYTAAGTTMQQVRDLGVELAIQQEQDVFKGDQIFKIIEIKEG